MRVIVKRERERDEAGVVALMVALLAVVLLVIAALVLDFGQAYMNKRQAQTAADAGALAAIKVYVDANATCPASGSGTPIVPVGGVLGDANQAAEEMRLANMREPDKGTGALTPVVCQDGAVTARYTVQTDSPVGLGQLAGSEDHLTVSREAVATYGTSGKGVGSLRPWMICGAYVPDPPVFPSKVIAIGLPGNGHLPSALDTDCDNPNMAGVWWRTQCLNEGGAHGDMLTNIREGCDTVKIVPNQDATDTPAERTAQLQGECRTESEHCMVDDTGRDSNSPQAFREWEKLVGKTVAMPVFCAKPTCSPTSVVRGGNWPVYKIAAVTICGVSINHSDSAMSTEPECANNPDGHTPATTFDGHGDMGFLVVFKGLIESGGASEFTVDVETTMRLVE